MSLSKLLSALITEFVEKTAAAKPKIKYTEFEQGIVINADSTISETFEFVKKYLNGKKIDMFCFDPPYLINVKSLNNKTEEWDKIKTSQQEAVDWMFDWTKLWWSLLKDNGAFWLWGGTGTYKMRPFFLYMTQAEGREDMDMYIGDIVTWRKRRSFGSPRKMLYIREECALIYKATENNPRVFNVPYLDKLRGYDGFGKYKALSKYLRRGNVWDDITELFNNKYHSCQKPIKLIEIPIEINTKKTGIVLDIFAGSGTTAFAAINLGRKFILIENDTTNYNNIVKRLKKFKPGDKLPKITD